MNESKMKTSDVSVFSFTKLHSRKEAEAILRQSAIGLCVIFGIGILIQLYAGLNIVFYIVPAIYILIVAAIYKYKIWLLSFIVILIALSELVFRIFNKLTDQQPAAIILPLIAVWLSIQLCRASYNINRAS